MTFEKGVEPQPQQQSRQKDLSFFIGDPSILLDKEMERAFKGNVRLFEFLELFPCEDDRYFALNIFEEKLVLTIEECTEEEYATSIEWNRNKKCKLYNLFLEAKTIEERFYVESVAEKQYIIDFCNFFDLKYN